MKYILIVSMLVLAGCKAQKYSVGDCLITGPVQIKITAIKDGKYYGDGDLFGSRGTVTGNVKDIDASKDISKVDCNSTAFRD